MPLLNISDYSSVIHRVLLGHLKPVAYGVNPAVNLAYPMRPDYFVSAEPVEELPEDMNFFWKRKPLETLANEDPTKTLIIACNGNDEAAWKAVSAYGDFPVIRFFSYEFLAPYLPALTQLPKTYKRARKNTKAKRAIILRGLIGTDNYRLAIQKLAHDHPDDAIILSTWDNTPKEDLSRIETLVDRIVTSPVPPYAGTQHRNLQITLAQAGLKAAAETGAEKCFICRTDILITKATTLDGFDWLMDKFPLANIAQPHQKGRLIIPHIFTRRFIPYNASDLFAYGWMEDVANLWNASKLDDRRDDSPLYLPQGMQTNLDTAIRNKTVVETYFWLNYMEKIGYRPHFTLQDWMEFLRDYLLIADMHTQRILWLAKDFYDHSAMLSRFKMCVNYADWAELAYLPQDAWPRIDLHQVTWQDFVNSP